MITIVIPTCNRNDLLEKCLTCLSYNNQKLDENIYEIIVSDDSKNDSAKTLIESKFPWVKWISGPKRGPAANRNNGARYAKGDWLIFIDDDCLPTSNLIQEYKHEIDKGKYRAFEGAIDVDRPRQRFDEEAPINLSGGVFWTCNVAIEKCLFREIGGFDDKFPSPAMEDIDLYIRIKGICPVLYINKALVIHPWRRIKTFSTYKKHLSSHRYFLEKYPYDNRFKYIISRIKIFIGSLYYDFFLLSSMYYQGVLFYVEKAYLNFLMIFL